MAPKFLSRLSRDSLINLAINWLEKSSKFHSPYLCSNRDMTETTEEDYLYTPAEDVEELRKVYQSLKDEKAATKRDIVDRIVEGDWRRGLSLHQLAMIDLQYLEENDTCLRWSALKLVPLSDEDKFDNQPAKKRRRLDDAEVFPQIQPETFLQSLKHEISPLVKAHYHLHRLPAPYHLAILRLYITDSLYANSKASTRSHSPEASRTLYIALPTSCPYIYVAVSGASSGTPKTRQRVLVSRPDIASMKRTILEAIPRAFSRPQERYALESTDLSVRSLRAICEMRGTGRAAESNGVYSWFAEAAVDMSPLETRAETVLPEREDHGVRKRKHEDEHVLSRFGPGLQYAALDRLHIRVKDITSASEIGISTKKQRVPPDPQPVMAPLSISFSGTDVIRGLRKLAGLGSTCIDLEKMPAWMTGEMCVSSLTV